MKKGIMYLILMFMCTLSTFNSTIKLAEGEVVKTASASVEIKQVEVKGYGKPKEVKSVVVKKAKVDMPKIESPKVSIKPAATKIVKGGSKYYFREDNVDLYKRINRVLTDNKREVIIGKLDMRLLILYTANVESLNYHLKPISGLDGEKREITRGMLQLQDSTLKYYIKAKKMKISKYKFNDLDRQILTCYDLYRGYIKSKDPRISKLAKNKAYKFDRSDMYYTVYKAVWNTTAGSTNYKAWLKRIDTMYEHIEDEKVAVIPYVCRYNKSTVATKKINTDGKNKKSV